MTTASASATAPVSVRPSVLLAAKLARLRRKHLSTAGLTGLALAVGVGLEVLALALFLDWWLDLAWGLRLALLAGQAVLLGWIVARHLLIPWLRRPDEEALALRVEQASPEFRGRLIASVQLTRPGAIPPGASPALVNAMVEQTEALAAPMDFAQIVPTAQMKKLGAVAGCVTALAALVLALGGPEVRVLLRRAFLSHEPVPRKTRVVVTDGHKVIGRGDSVRLAAEAQGLIPGHGRLEVRPRHRRPQLFPLDPDPDHRARFARTLDNVQESFAYVIYLNDGRSEPFTVKVLPRPAVASVRCEQHFPAYTRLPPLRRSVGDLTLLAGSTLHVQATATKEVRTAALKLIPTASPAPAVAAPTSHAGPVANHALASSDPPAAQPAGAALATAVVPGTNAARRAAPALPAEVPLQINPQDRRELRGSLAIPAAGLAGFSFQMTDTEGMASRDPVVYRIEILPDKAPVVRLTYPDRKEELYTRQATALIGLEAVDDFAIRRVWLRYRLNGLDASEEKAVELDLGAEQPARLRRRFEWKLGEFNSPLPEGARLEYWVEVWDNNEVTGPGVGRSEPQFAKIVSEAEKRADLLNRAGDYLGSVSDVAGDQEKANQALGAVILEKAAAK